MKLTFFAQNQRKEWNDFLLENNGHFLQSFEWGEIQRSEGKKVWRLRVEQAPDQDKLGTGQEGEVLAQAQIIKHSLAFGRILGKSFFYLPFGPCFKQAQADNGEGEARPRQKESRAALDQLFLGKMREIAKQENAVFLHLEPFKPSKVPRFDWVGSDKDIQPRKTLVLDLNKTEQELLNGFSQKARYNIHLAEKKAVKTFQQSGYHPDFYRLLKKTAEQNEFKAFSESHYQKLFDLQSEQFKVKMFLAQYQNEIIAAYILVIFGRQATCLHGASDKDYKQLKAVNLLQWERIKYAKEQGCEQIDFWGIDEKKWPGITYFKKTFGGREVEHPQRHDVVFQGGWYKVYKCCKKVLRKS